MLYIFDAQKEPVEEKDTLKWAEWMEKRTADEIIVDTTDFITTKGDINVSTVFLGISHPSKHLNDDRMMLFETMVFAKNVLIKRLMEIAETDDRGIIAMLLDIPEIQVRYVTRKEAEQGHKRLCTFVETCIVKGLI